MAIFLPQIIIKLPNFLKTHRPYQQFKVSLNIFLCTTHNNCLSITAQQTFYLE